jgi:nucleotide-binding universal stress UspA family protein
MLNRILVPVDGSTLSEAAIPMALEVTADRPCELELLRVVPSLLQGGVSFLGMEPVPMIGPDWDDAHDEEIEVARQYLERLAARLPAEVRVTRSVRLGNPAEEIVQRARDGFGLIVMSTHGRTGLGRWVLGSVADAVVRGSFVPVLLVRPETGRHTSAGTAAVETRPTG